jgi:NAD(P)-dependent dehydrogenase (short-subunit alcohol dehydrogenase family)
MQFKDKIVVITGSSSGIGKAVAKAFAKEGAKLVINSKTNIQGGEEVVHEIIANGGEAIYLQADISKPEEVSAFFSKIIEKYGTVDILVNNAGGTIPSQSILDLTYDKRHEMLDINLTSTMLCSQEAIKIMKKA